MVDQQVYIYTTLALIGGQIDSAILKAIAINLEIEAVDKVVVVTETFEHEIITKYPLFSHDKLVFRSVDSRPSFADMINIIDDNYEAIPNHLAILLNADISPRTGEAIEKLIRSFEVLGGHKQLAFVLTRYDVVKGVDKLSLNTQIGLPNVMSADVWVFNRPVLMNKDAFYSLGQMFCDQFFCHDLVASGYEVFNPCLDVVFVHHEKDVKSVGYYSNEANKQKSRVLLEKHWKESVSEGGNYIGLSRVSTHLLNEGFLPAPVSLRADLQRVFWLLQKKDTITKSYLRELVATSAAGLRVDIFLVCEDEFIFDMVLEFARELQPLARVYAYRVDSITQILNNLSVGKRDTYDRISVVNKTDIEMSGFFNSKTIFINCTEKSIGLYHRLLMLIKKVRVGRFN